MNYIVLPSYTYSPLFKQYYNELKVILQVLSTAQATDHWSFITSIILSILFIIDGISTNIFLKGFNFLLIELMVRLSPAMHTVSLWTCRYYDRIYK